MYFLYFRWFNRTANMNMAWTLTAIFELKSANSFNVLEIWLDIVTDFELGNLLWNKLEMEQEYPIIWFQPDVKSLRELVYCYKHL